MQFFQTEQGQVAKRPWQRLLGKLRGQHAREPWTPPDYEDADVYAVQAVALGHASPQQQQRAIKYIVERVCETYGLSYRPGSERDTAFAEGKRFVGLQIVKFVKLNVAALRGKVNEEGETPREKENG